MLGASHAIALNAIFTVIMVHNIGSNAQSLNVHGLLSAVDSAASERSIEGASSLIGTASTPTAFPTEDIATQLPSTPISTLPIGTSQGSDIDPTPLLTATTTLHAPDSESSRPTGVEAVTITSASSAATATTASASPPSSNDGGRRNEIIALVLGLVLGLALVVSLTLGAVLLRRRRRSREVSGEAGEQRVAVNDPENLVALQGHRPHRDWPWRKSTTRSIANAKPSGEMVENKRLARFSGPLTTHGGFWDASNQAATPLVTSLSQRSESSATPPVSSTSSAISRRSTFFPGSPHDKRKDPSEGFEEVTLTGGCHDRASDELANLTTNRSKRPAEEVGNPVMRTDSFLRRLRQPRYRSISLGDDRTVAYPSQEELEKFDFGLPQTEHAGGTTRAERLQAVPRPVATAEHEQTILPGPWVGRRSMEAKSPVRHDSAIWR